MFRIGQDADHSGCLWPGTKRNQALREAKRIRMSEKVEAVYLQYAQMLREKSGGGGGEPTGDDTAERR